MKTPFLLAVFFLLMLPLLCQAQEKAELPPTQMGVRFNWGFEFISKNTINGQEFTLLETGQHVGFGGFLNIAAEENVQFSPFIGLTHIFFPKGTNYSGVCDEDSFPTFWSVYDSVPGRNHRFWNLTVEPSFKFYLSKLGVHLRIIPAFHYNIRARTENYSNSCGSQIPQSWLTWEDTDQREMSRFQVEGGISLVKEVRLNDRSHLWLETGYRAALTPLLRVRDPDPDRKGFTLYPSGWFVNLGFFR